MARVANRRSIMVPCGAARRCAYGVRCDAASRRWRYGSLAYAFGGVWQALRHLAEACGSCSGRSDGGRDSSDSRIVGCRVWTKPPERRRAVTRPFAAFCLWMRASIIVLAAV